MPRCPIHYSRDAALRVGDKPVGYGWCVGGLLQGVFNACCSMNNKYLRNEQLHVTLSQCDLSMDL